MAMMLALIEAVKRALDFLPNVELVTFLFLVFTILYGKRTILVSFAFTGVETLVFGGGIWVVMYLYIWYLLALLAWLARKMDNALFWAVFSGLYGLCFGGLCAAVYLFAKTPAFALSWWLSGLSYDAMHGVGNFVLMLLLYHPLRRALWTVKRQMKL